MIDESTGVNTSFEHLGESYPDWNYDFDIESIYRSQFGFSTDECPKCHSQLIGYQVNLIGLIDDDFEAYKLPAFICHSCTTTVLSILPVRSEGEFTPVAFAKDEDLRDENFDFKAFSFYEGVKHRFVNSDTGLILIPESLYQHSLREAEGELKKSAERKKKRKQQRDSKKKNRKKK